MYTEVFQKKRDNYGNLFENIMFANMGIMILSICTFVGIWGTSIFEIWKLDFWNCKQMIIANFEIERSWKLNNLEICKK